MKEMPETYELAQRHRGAHAPSSTGTRARREREQSALVGESLAGVTTEDISACAVGIAKTLGTLGVPVMDGETLGRGPAHR